MPAFHVDRSTVIDAPVEQVFDVVADFGTWATWSPWLGADKDAEVTVTEDPDRVGSIYQWAGEVVGQGEVEHVRLNRPHEIVEEIRFVKPYKSRSDVSFQLSETNGATKITWSMDGKLPWFMFWMISSMKAFIGMDYERGLKMLKELIETGTVLSDTDIGGVESVPARTVIGRSESCKVDVIGERMSAILPDVHEKLSSAGVVMNEVISIYHPTSDLSQCRFDFTSGFVVPPDTPAPSGTKSYPLPSTKVLAVRHTGSYQNLGNSWSAAYQYARYKKLKTAKADCFEIYRNDPHETPAAELVTDIYIPIR